MEKEKAGEEKGHIIILYRGNLSGRGKGGLLRKGGKGDAEGRGIYREREEKGHFGEEKGMVSGKGKETISG
ncbi:hypothetical protein ACIXIS_22895, partial [Bacteroides fragilis]